MSTKSNNRETPAQAQARLSGRLAPNPMVMDAELAINQPGAFIDLRNSVTMWVDQNGNCVLNYTATIAGEGDFVGVYANAAQPEGSNLGGSEGWQYCTATTTFPYTTDVAALQGYVAIYWSTDYRTGKYVAVAITQGLPADPVPGVAVTASTD